jgi:hypothetical protein
MAKSGTTSSVRKVSFGKKSVGKAKKAFNKNNRRERNYRGQGR